MTFYCLQIIWHERSQNRAKQVTNAWTDEYPTSNVRVVIDSLVMWETLLPSADCVYLKSQTQRLPKTFKINLGRNVYVFLGTFVPHLEIPHGLTDFIYHIRSPLEYRSISEGDLLAGGVGVRHAQQTCFRTTVDHMNIPVFIPRVEVNQPRKLPCTLKLGRSHKEVCGFV